MIEVDVLDALDLSLWYEGSVAVAAASGCSPSTTCRRLHQALECFQLRLRRTAGQGPAAGDGTLIGMQRRVHQHHRLMGGGLLRLHLPPWTRLRLDAEPPEGWLLNPRDELLHGDPLRLLQEGVIDACVVTPTQLAEHSPAGFACIELYRSPIELHGLSLEPELPLPDLPLEHLLGRVALAPPAFLPLSCRRASHERHVRLLDGKLPSRRNRCGEPWRLCYLAAEMAPLLAEAVPLPLPLDWTYREQLVVLAAHRDHPRVEALAEHLSKLLGEAQGCMLRAG